MLSAAEELSTAFITKMEDNDYELLIKDPDNNDPANVTRAEVGDVLLSIFEFPRFYEAATNVEYAGFTSATDMLTGVQFTEITSIEYGSAGLTTSAAFELGPADASIWTGFGLVAPNPGTIIQLYDDPPGVHLPGVVGLTTQSGVDDVSDGTLVSEFGFAGEAGEFFTASTAAPSDAAIITSITTFTSFANMDVTAGGVSYVGHDFLGFGAGPHDLQLQTGLGTGPQFPGDSYQIHTDTDAYLQVAEEVLGSIHAFGFEDLNADGIFDADELAWNRELPSKKIDLFDANGVLIASETTNIDGEVWFEDLQPGVYMLQEDLSVFAGGGNGSIMPSPAGLLPDGSFSPAGGAQRTVTVTSGAELVWEPGAAAGMLDPGQFEVLIDPDGSGRNEALMFGNFVKGSIHAFGYEDLDADGILDSEDLPWNRGVDGSHFLTWQRGAASADDLTLWQYKYGAHLPPKKIDLFDADGVLIASKTTNMDGEVWFENLTPGVYMLQEDLSVFPGGGSGTIMASPDPDGPGGVPGGADKRTVTITSGQELVYEDGAAAGMLEEGQFEELVDDGRLVFGNFVKGSIHVFGFLDEDGDGFQDAGEGGFPDDPGKTFELLDENGAVIMSDSTENGMVWFTGLVPGTYSVRENPVPDGFALTTLPNQRSYTIISGEELVYEDGAAMLPAGDARFETNLGDELRWGNTELAMLGDFVWEDLNANGIQDPNELDDGINGVTVKLLADADGDGQVDDVVATTVTTNNPATGLPGWYKFNGLTPGVEYAVMFNNPDPDGTDAYMFSPRQADGDPNSGVNSDGPMSDVVVLASGEFNDTLDAGLFRKGSIHVFGFLDEDGDGIQDGGEGAFPDDPGKRFELLDDGGNVIMSDSTENGMVWFTGLVPGTYSVRENPVPDGFALTTLPNQRSYTIISGEELVYEDGAAMLPAGDARFETNLGDELRWGNTPDNPEVNIEKFTRVDINPIDIEKLVRVEPSQGGMNSDQCDINGDIVALTFQYLVGSTASTNQDPGKAGVVFQGAVDDDGTSYLIVTDQSDASNALNGGGKRFFEGSVAVDEFFTANQATDNFGSATFIHFYDDANGPLLQSIEYHTSCSQPITLGDVIGNATLVGYDGVDGSAEIINQFGPGIDDADADTPTGPEANVGDTVVFTYVVTNPIPSTELSDIQVTDLVLAPVEGTEFSPDPVLDGGFNVGDVDEDNRLDAGERWLYVSTTPITSATAAGQYVDKATVLGTNAGGGEVMDMDPAHFIVPAGSTQDDQCDINGDIVALTFQYLVGSTASTNQDPGKAGVVFQGAVDDDGTSYLIVTDQSDASNALNGGGKRFFEGSVAVDEFFTANQATDNFGSATFIHFYDDANGPLLQSIEYHTSCSQPITLGDVIGNATLVGYDGVDGSAALPPTVDPPVIDLGGIMLTTDAPFDAGNIGLDADTPTGPIAQLGEKVTWTYVVSNPGGVPLTINSVFDDNETAPIPGLGADDFEPAPVLKANGFNFGDDNNDNLLDPGEVWYYQAMEIATEAGQHKNTAKVRAEDAAGEMVMDSDMSNHIVNPLVFEKYVSVPLPPSSEDQCDVNGKVVTLTFEYLPGTNVITGQDAGKATATGSADTDGESYIVVGNGDLFEGLVLEGEVFTIGGSFGSNTVFEIYDDLAAFQAGQNPLQTLEYHTSCSQPIQLGDVVGSVILVGYEGENGSATQETGLGDAADSPTGPTVLLGEEVVFNYEIFNAGNVGLVNVAVTDDVLGQITGIVDDGNGDNILDPGETWVYSASTIAATSGQQMNLGTVTANSVQDPTGKDLTASDPAYHFVETLKFFVVDNDTDATFTYTDGGSPIGSTGLNSGNHDPRGATSNAAGDTLWVVDKDKNVYSYDANGDFVSNWRAENVSDKVQGIATHGDDIWIVQEDRKVYFFEGGAGFVSGDKIETTMFTLSGSDIDKPAGITTDGTSLWVVDKNTDKVYTYTTGGTFVASWALDSGNGEPRGITINPADPADDTIWVVDENAGMVFVYANGKSNSGGTLSGMFALASGNTKPEGIADPPPLAVFESTDTYLNSSATAFVGVDARPGVPGDPIVLSSLSFFNDSDDVDRRRTTVDTERAMTDIVFARTYSPPVATSMERTFQSLDDDSTADDDEQAIDTLFARLGGLTDDFQELL